MPYTIISSGKTSDGIILMPYDRLSIDNGGTANHTTVNSDSHLTVCGGGTASNTTINSGGTMNVLKGGSADTTTISSGGRLYVSGTATNIVWTPCEGYISRYGGAVVTFAEEYSGVYYGSSGQLLSHAASIDDINLLDSPQELIVMSGGTANNTTVKHGSLCVYSGGTANNTTINSDGYVHILNGATFDDTLVYISGTVFVYSGGIMNRPLASWGRIYLNGGIANNANIKTAWLNISNGGIAYNTSISGGAVLNIYDGGTANTVNLSEAYAYVSSGGTLNSARLLKGNVSVYSGGTANFTSVNNTSYLDVFSGGIAINTTITAWGFVRVQDSGIANYTTVTNSGEIHLSEGGVANNTTAKYEGRIYLYSGGTANSTTLYSKGTLKVNENCIANNVDVKPGGMLFVSSGGTATEILENGGYVDVSAGANVTFLKNTFSGAGISSSTATIHSGTTAIRLTADSDGDCVVSSSGIAVSPVIGSTGRLFVSSGGTATNIIWTPIEGKVSIAPGATVTFASKYSEVYYGSGNTLISHDTQMDEKTLDSSCKLLVLSGGIVNSTIVKSYGYIDVSSGGTANSTNLNSDGYIYINSGGTANSTFVNSRGVMRLNESGTANSTIMNGGIFYVGGLANNTTVNSGWLQVSSGGTAAGAIVGSNGKVTVCSGGTATDIVWTPCEGFVVVEDGGVATFASEYSGVYYGENGELVSSAQKIDGMLLDYTCDMYVMNGGVVNRTKLSDAGGLDIWSGGVANSTTLASSSWIYVSCGGVANSTTAKKDCEIYVHSGGVMNNTTLKSGAYLYLSSGGTINKTVVSGCVYFYNGVDAAGGTANSTTVCAGANVDLWKSVLNTTTVNSAGELILNPGTIANGTTVNSRGKMYISSGARLTGQTTLKAGAIVSAYGGATIDFDISALTPQTAKTARLNALSLVSGWADANFTLTVSGTQQAGKYSLAGGATKFNKTISVVNTTGRLLGELTLGETATIGNAQYLVSVASGKLTLTVSGQETILPDNVLPTVTDITPSTLARAESVTVTAVFADDVELVQSLYRIGEDGAWKDYADGVTVRENTTVFFKAVDAAGNDSEAAAYTVTNIRGTPPVAPDNLVGTAERVSWGQIGIEQYVVEYSTDSFEHTIAVSTMGNAIDPLELPAGTYQWRVKVDGKEEWSVGETIVSGNGSDTPELVQSNEDGFADMFFANIGSTWDTGHSAKHTGIRNGWSGTGETIRLVGRNKLADIFEGSSDASILLMTDDTNGDALFMDDIYTALPGALTQQQARIAMIDEIRAGAGDDIVDMTSQRFDYTGSGLTIRGGTGNDTIWANKGDNFLFGDAGKDRIVGASGNDVIAGGIGNDRLHGGGGDDVFTFCDNWGTDEVEQLGAGTVTLWFASGSESNWDASSLTYTDGANSVKVFGVSAERVTLKFGDNGSDEFAALTAAGAFLDATTECIFETSGRGILASL